MANEQNLLKKEDRTPEQRRESARKAGKASAKAYKRRKELAEQARVIGSLEISPDLLSIRKSLEKLGINAEVSTFETAMIVALIQKAIKGDTRAFQIYMDLVYGRGDKKLEKKIAKAELELKKKEIEFKQRELDKMVAEDTESKVIIVNDLEGFNDKDD